MAQYVAITVPILEKGVADPEVPFHLVSGAILWGTLAITIISGADYFYRFFLRTGSDAIVRERERWP